MPSLSTLVSTGVLALAGLAASSPTAYPLQANDTSPYPFPDIADTTHATDDLVDFLHEYFTAKSLHAPERWLESFANPALYIDAVLGWYFDASNFTEAVHNLTSSWTSPAAISYPLRIIGDTDSAVVFFKSTPEAFGSEISGVGIVDFEDGKVVRQVDYWDGRRVPLISQRVPDTLYPQDFGEEEFSNANTSPVIQGIAQDLHAAFSAANSTAAALLFSTDAVFEDKTARAKIEGVLAIERYLGRVLKVVPYGVGATVRHVVGSELGGGYEFVGGAESIARNGVVAVELDDEEKITRATVVWDGSRAANGTVEAIVKLAIEP